MSTTYKVKSIEVVQHADTGVDFLDVKVEQSEGKTKTTRKFGFPITSTKEEIAAELDKVMACVDADSAHQKMIASNEAQLKKVEEMRKELVK